MAQLFELVQEEPLLVPWITRPNENDVSIEMCEIKKRKLNVVAAFTLIQFTSIAMRCQRATRRALSVDSFIRRTISGSRKTAFINAASTTKEKQAPTMINNSQRFLPPLTSFLSKNSFH